MLRLNKKWMGILVGACLLLGGCRVPVVVWESPGMEPARQAFLAGEYPRARTLFLEKYEAAGDDETRAAAAQALACTEMMMARTPEAYFKCMRQSVDFSQPIWENQELLSRALSHGLELYHRKYRSDFRKIRDQNKALWKLKELNRTLRHQIRSLERIDREIHEKRTNS